MAEIKVLEKLTSRTLLASRDGKVSTYEVLLIVTGTMDPGAAKNAADFFSPPTFGNPPLWKQTVLVEVIGPDSWEAKVRYDSTAPESLSANNAFELEISGGTAHITSSLATAAYPPTLPDHGGAIGVTEDNVQGADVYSPETTFSFTRYYTEFPPSRVATLIGVRGKVNNTPFQGLGAGQVLFEGASVRLVDNRPGTPWVVTYRFRLQLNAIVSAGDSGPVDKAGWDLFEIRYEPVVVDDALVQLPIGGYLHQVYERADFSVLGI